jgi:hypothetical protein
MCTFASSKPTCTVAESCIQKYIACIDNVALTNSSCVGTANLRVSLNAVESGSELYNASAAWTDCKYRACTTFNQTAGNCSFHYGNVCRSPVNFLGTVMIKGSFTAILADATKREQFAVALDADISLRLRISGCFVTRMYVYGTTRPATERPRPTSAARRSQATSENMIIEYTAPGVTASNTALKTNLNALAADKTSTWLSSTATVYTSLTAGQTVASLGFIGAAEGSGSGAFSSGKFKSIIAANPPGPVTPPSPPSPTSTTKSGAAVQSVLAAIIVAVLSYPMLF